MKQEMKALKAQAKNLHAALKARGVKEPLSYAQELIAAQYGQPNWDTLCGVVGANDAHAAQPLRLSDLPKGQIPHEILFGFGRTDIMNVAGWEAELIGLADSEEVLRQYVAKNFERYPEGMATVVVYLQGDGFDVRITAEELSSGRHVNLLGYNYWHTPARDLYLRFVYATRDKWARSVSAAQTLTIPEVSRSVKGVKLITLTSTDGPEWNLQLLVPPHLDAEAVAERVQAELKRLHELDAAHEGDPEYAEYTNEDLQRFVATLGCALMWPVKTIGPWD